MPFAPPCHVIDRVVGRDGCYTEGDLTPVPPIPPFAAFGGPVVGLARINTTDQHSLNPARMVDGTIQYVSPEQIRGDALDGRADQFSMAAIAYEMLTGKPPFEATSPVTMAQKIVNETPVAAHVQNPLLPEGASAVLAKALDRQPSGRYPNCTAFVETLIATFDGATVQALLRPPEEQPTVALTSMNPKLPTVVSW